MAKKKKKSSGTGQQKNVAGCQACGNKTFDRRDVHGKKNIPCCSQCGWNLYWWHCATHKSWQSPSQKVCPGCKAVEDQEGVRHDRDRRETVYDRKHSESRDDRLRGEHRIEVLADRYHDEQRGDDLHVRDRNERIQACPTCGFEYDRHITECPRCTLQVEQELEVRQSYNGRTGETTLLIEYSTKVGSGSWQGQACTVRVVASAIGLSVEENIPVEGGSVDISPNSSEFDVVIDVIRAPRGNPKATAMATIRATATRFRKSTRL